MIENKNIKNSSNRAEQNEEYNIKCPEVMGEKNESIAMAETQPATIPPVSPVPAAPGVPITTTIPGAVPDDVKRDIIGTAARTGLKCTKLEKVWADAYAKACANSMLDEFTRKRLATWSVAAVANSYTEHPLIDYDIVVIGSTMAEHPKYTGSNIICGSYLPGIDADPLSPTKPGILTTISVNEQNYKIVEKMQPFSFYKVNVSKTMLGERRDLFAGSHSEFVEVNRTDITKEQMMVWLNKNYPIQTLAALKNNLSKTIAAKQAGKQPRVDILDFRQIEVYITQAKNGITKDSKWYLYTVQDDSLSEDEKRETKIGDKTIYGGVTMSVPRHIYEQLNLDAGSIIRALVTVRKSAPAEDGIQKSKVGIQLDAIAVFALVPVEKRKPQIQGASQQLGKNVGVGAFDLTSQ